MAAPKPAGFSLWKRKRYLVVAGAGALFVGLAAGGCALYVLFKFRRAEILPASVHDKTSRYIYISSRDSSDLSRKDIQDRIPVRVEKYFPELFRPANLLRASAMSDPQFRRQIIDEMTRHQWLDWEAYQIAQKAFADPKLMVAIARSQIFNPKLLFKPAKLRRVYLEPSVRDEMTRILTACPVVSVYGKLTRKKEKVLSLAADRKGFSLMDYVTLIGPPSDMQVVRALIDGLSEFSEDPASCVVMRDAGVIRVINRLMKEERLWLTMDDFRLVVRILANVSANALSPGMVEEISKAGLLPWLSEWSASKDLDLCLRASKALANLDPEVESAVYTSGVYLLHPLRRLKAEPVFDVVFVHGLRGGVLKTWRQNVRSIKELQPLDSAVGGEESYLQTLCWPKDWLSLDFPSSRIIAVDYETSFFQSPYSPGEGESVMLLRSIDMLNRLKQAGLGTRPIIWIAHSMGGILVKQMLLLSAGERNSPILQKTLGCVFYSTPHIGSPFADQMARLVKLSPEVLDLRMNNPYLVHLQAQFADLVADRNFSVLSFGETRPDYIRTRFVPTDSSNPRMGKFIELGDTSHFYSCKPVNPRSAMYYELIQFMREVLVNYQNFSVQVQSSTD
ncbi:Protein SERAC1 [Hypsibius exemplaris]|uniref:Protein SERAC1 n=1 Tax=Hypsibius exemplaris TaxID=2072580 RepID=A0A9X6NI23_HYPEX|nr:Protein SERAC1 [Hypsibius exemplaris]